MDIAAVGPREPKLTERLRGALARHRLSRRTAQGYTSWILRFIRYHNTRNPALISEPEVLAFLTWLAETRRVSHSTQIQATSALPFLYRR